MGIPKFVIDGLGKLIARVDSKRPGGFGEWGLKTGPIGRLELATLSHSQVASLLIGGWRRAQYAWRRDETERQIEGRNHGNTGDSLSIRTPRSFNSSEDQVPLAIDSILSTNGPSDKPGTIHSAGTRQMNGTRPRWSRCSGLAPAIFRDNRRL